MDSIDQLRKYTVHERDDDYVITYKNGFDSGMPMMHARVNKETGEVTYV